MLRLAIAALMAAGLFSAAPRGACPDGRCTAPPPAIEWIAPRVVAPPARHLVAPPLVIGDDDDPETIYRIPVDDDAPETVAPPAPDPAQAPAAIAPVIVTDASGRVLYGGPPAAVHRAPRSIVVRRGILRRSPRAAATVRRRCGLLRRLLGLCR